MALICGPMLKLKDEIDPLTAIRAAFAAQAELGPGDVRCERLRVRRDPHLLAWRWSLTATAPWVCQRDVVRLAVEKADGRWVVAGRRDHPGIANGVALLDPDRGWVVVADTDDESNATLIRYAIDHIEMLYGG